MSADQAAVESTISHYLDGVRTGDREHFDRAFTEGAMISHYSVSDDKIEHSSLDAFVTLVQELLTQYGSVEETLADLDVQLADQVGTARAGFTLELGEHEATGHDVFSLAKVAGQWLITHKLYSM